MHTLVCIVFLGILLVSHENPLELSDSDFTKELLARGQLFTLFFAEWCGHCKKLTPTWEKLSKDTEVTESVAVAKVDCSGNGKETCTHFGVSGYPTIKFVQVDSSGSENVIDYNGARTEESLQSFALLHSRPAFSELDDDELKVFINTKSSAVVVAFISNQDSKIFEQFKKVATSLKSKFRFGYTFSKIAAESYGFSKDTVALFRQSFLKTNLEENVVSTSDPSSMEDFLVKNMHGLVGYRNSENEKEFGPQNVAIFFNFDPNLQESLLRLIRNRMIPIAKEYKNLSFSVSAVEDYRQMLEGMFSVEDKGIFIIIYNERQQRYPFFGSLSVSSANDFQSKLKNFVSDYVAGKLVKPYIKSEAVPTSESDSVKVVVGQTFENIVYDETKDVLIEMYAPWCGHCKKLEPIYKKLAEALKDEDKIVIAKMDATQNDAPEHYTVRGYPTIFFAKIGKKDSPVIYEENREVPDMIEWLRKHASHPLKLSSKDVEEL